ncbi:YdeI/OmpD-associated family protein [Pseudotamlana agarivorans]|uniref:YdeI/OmpD-associated family protein n=1 Tax=Pseudotamlana agarivorans TaxID=481183 RepID=UPI00082BE794|nr:YdeI/OmpD-associated family protein [Tamlana agarivorans]
MKKVNSVEEYLENHDAFRDILETLRALILSTPLEETIKWNAPTYTINNKNVLSIAAFNNHCCIWFYNGLSLKDEHQLFSKEEDANKALRQMRFETHDAINKPMVLAYIKEAIENEKLGNIVKHQKMTKELIIPEALQAVLQKNPALKSQFENLAPYKQREYCEHILTAKRDATKQARLEKIQHMILKGIGLNDKYKNC